MRIIVPIKQVPETNAVKMDEATGTMIREGVEAIINPLDLYAIEIAIQIREGRPPGSTEVIALSMGPPKAASALKEAIAMGIDSAVLVSDKAFAGSDTWATSYVLAAAIRKLGSTGVGGTGFQPVPVVSAGTAPQPVPAGSTGPWGPKAGWKPVPPDLILCGERATDGDTGQVGPGIASFLDLPVVSYVGKIESVEGGKVRVHRLVEDGHEVLECDLPAVLTVIKEVASPRLPTLSGKLKAKKAQIPLWGPKDLEVEMSSLGLEGSPTRVVKIFRPKVARQCRKMLALDERAVAKAVDELVEFLRKKELV
jgi:electron transfer flavoprotein beta subunit